jgi:hypothetical protein
MEKNGWVKEAIQAVDQYNVDRNIDGLRPFFDIKNDSNALKNAPYLLQGDSFTYAFGNRMKSQKRLSELPNLIIALIDIDPARYKSFKGLKSV